VAVYYTVSTGFHLIMGYFVKRILHPDDEFTIIMHEHSKEMVKDRFDTITLSRVFDDVIWENDLSQNEKMNFHKCFKDTDFFYLSSFGQTFGCDLYRVFPDKGMRVLIYEGLNTYWVSKFAITHTAHDPILLVESADSILVLDKEMSTDQIYLSKVKEFPVKEWLNTNKAFEKCCFELNELFKYQYTKIEQFPKLIYFGRYLPHFQERASLVLSCIVSCLKETDFSIKLHPREIYNEEITASVTNSLPDATVPWDLIQLNRLIHGDIQPREVYVGYASSVLYHDASLWGIENYTSIVLEKLVYEYLGKLSPAFDGKAIAEVFTSFDDKYNSVNVVYPNTFDELYSFVSNRQDEHVYKKINWEAIHRKSGCDETYTRDLKLWITLNLMQKNEMLRSLPNDSLLSENKNLPITYRCIGNERTASITKHFLSFFPALNENEECFDVTIICENYLLTDNPFVFGYGVYFEHTFYLKLKKMLEKMNEIYIWGLTESSESMYQVIAKNGLLPKFKGFIDSFKYGTHKSYPIYKHDEIEKKDGQIIIICAEIAWRSIEKILTNRGFEKDTDYCFGHIV